jgi:hypothetical protein
MALPQVSLRSSSFGIASKPAVRGLSAVLLMLLASACQTVEPVTVNPSFTTATALLMRRPAEVAVLPVEDATPGGKAARHLVFLRQELMRQIVDRKYTPLTASTVDAAMRGNADVAAARATGGSILEPAVFQKLAGHSSEDAMLLLRLDHWDESSLMVTKRVNFRCQAALVGGDGQQLWFGTLSGDIKAGGGGASPRDRDSMARSCGELMIREVLLRLPEHQPSQVSK